MKLLTVLKARTAPFALPPNSRKTERGAMKLLTVLKARTAPFALPLTLLALFCLAASAADVTGNWKGAAETPNGAIERTFTFKQDGTKLTGETVSQMLGKSEIADGKVEGDDVTFTIKVKFQDNEMQLTYKGKVSGDTIKFTVEGANGMRIEYNAKKVS